METPPPPVSAEIEALHARIRMLGAEVETLREHLHEAEEIVYAIRGDAVDAVVVGEPEPSRVYTFAGADHPYRVLVEAMHEGAVTLDRDGTILYANLSFAELVRVPPGQMTGTAFQRFVSPGEASRFEALLRHESRAKTELTLLAEGAAEVPVYLSRSPADLGSVQAVCLVVSDLTEQKQHAEMLASERLAQSILEQAAEAILVCDAAGRVTHASRQAEVLFGCNPLWQPFETLFPLAAAPADGAVPSDGREATFTRADGRTFHVLLSSATLQGDGQRVLGTVHILTDITERKEAAEALHRSERALKALNETLEERVARRTAELSRANLALTQKNRELQDFAYVASHDLQEPLRKISAFSNLLRDECGEGFDETGHFYMQRIQDAAGRMSDLLRDLLVFSRIATHGQPFRPVDLNDVFAEVCTDLDLAIGEAGAVVQADPLPRVEADPYQMRQLLQHLLGNALKFRKAGAPPVVRVRGGVRTAAPDGEECEVAYVEVEDDGIGFDEKYLDRIFTPFQRLHGRGQYEGTGMGLAICRRIVERHQGTLTARSTPGSGATFVVMLPLVGKS